MELEIDGIALSKQRYFFSGDRNILCSAKGFSPNNTHLKIQLYLGDNEIDPLSIAARTIDKEGSEKAKVEVYRLLQLVVWKSIAIAN